MRLTFEQVHNQCCTDRQGLPSVLNCDVISAEKVETPPLSNRQQRKFYVENHAT